MGWPPPAADRPLPPARGATLPCPRPPWPPPRLAAHGSRSLPLKRMLSVRPVPPPWARMEGTQAQASPRGSSALVHVTVSSLTPKLLVAWNEGAFSTKGSSEASVLPDWHRAGFWVCRASRSQGPTENEAPLSLGEPWSIRCRVLGVSLQSASHQLCDPGKSRPLSGPLLPCLQHRLTISLFLAGDACSLPGPLFSRGLTWGNPAFKVIGPCLGTSMVVTRRTLLALSRWCQSCCSAPHRAQPGRPRRVRPSLCVSSALGERPSHPRPQVCSAEGRAEAEKAECLLRAGT